MTEIVLQFQKKIVIHIVGKFNYYERPDFEL